MVRDEVGTILDEHLPEDGYGRELFIEITCQGLRANAEPGNQPSVMGSVARSENVTNRKK